MKMFKKGFTLIELLVVIAIIGILSAVVLASLNTAQDRGADAAVQSQLSSMRAEGVLFQADNNSYDGLFDGVASDTEDPAHHAGVLYEAALDQGGDGYHSAGDNHFVAAVELSEDEAVFCVDDGGFAGEIAVTDITTVSGESCEEIAN